MSTPDLTVSGAARILRTRRENVLTLIKSGALAGYDVTPPGTRRKSYRITRQALADFRRRRSAQQTTASRRKKPKQPKSQDFVEYF